MSHAEQRDGTAGLVLRLADQMDRIEVQLDGLRVDAGDSGEQVRTLTRHLTTPRTATEAEERLAEILTRLEAVEQQVEELAGSLTRLNRVQFKANALLEGRAEESARAVAALQEIATRRDETRAQRSVEEAGRLSALRAEGRAAMAADLLPVIDGIERALEGGAALLERHRTAPDPRPARSGWQRWLRRIAAGPEASAGTRGEGVMGALAGWLEGLRLGHERFLALLAAEDVRPMEALHAPFDPHLHVAVASEPRGDVAPGTIVRVLRPGYRRGKRPVRFAEVVVSSAPREPDTDTHKEE